MEWFRDALTRHASSKRGRSPVVAAVEEWLGSSTFRGCAFINSVNELGAEIPEIHAIATRHKADMVAAIAETLPSGSQRPRTARALGAAVDGAVVQAQVTHDTGAAIEALDTIAARLVVAKTRR